MNNKDIQLLPTQKKKFSFGVFKGNNTLLSVAVLALVVLTVAVGILKFMTHATINSIEAIDNELSVIYQARNKDQEERLLNFERQVNATKSLLSSHVVWVDGLKEVQRLVEPRVTFLSLTADASKRTYIFHAVADSYSTVARQIASFYKSDAMNDIKLDKVGIAGDGRIDFTMQLTFKPDHFLLRKSP